jgi:hypothetical protein
MSFPAQRRAPARSRADELEIGMIVNGRDGMPADRSGRHWMTRNMLRKSR